MMLCIVAQFICFCRFPHVSFSRSESRSDNAPVDLCSHCVQSHFISDTILLKWAVICFGIFVFIHLRLYVNIFNVMFTEYHLIFVS